MEREESLKVNFQISKLVPARGGHGGISLKVNFHILIDMCAKAHRGYKNGKD